MSAVRVALLLTLIGCGGVAPQPTQISAGASSVDKQDVARVEPQKLAGIATGDFHTCALVVGGTVVCWGRNRDGELGDGGAAGNRSRPVIVPNLRDVEQIAAGHGFACARLKSGKVRCWGSGNILGDAPVERVRPTDVEGVSGAVELKAGGLVACVRNATGAVKCWGTSAIKQGAPSAGAEELAVSGAHACARTLDGKVSCWGEGLARNPKPGAELTKVASISTGDSFVCAIVEGNVRCLGRNDQGELGAPPDTETRTKPITVKNVSAAARISSAEARTCALLKNESLMCWGSNHGGELGRGSRTSTELAGPVRDLAHVLDVAVGAGHACALLKDATVMCWGNNRQGQLGDGTLEDRATPVKLAW